MSIDESSVLIYYVAAVVCFIVGGLFLHVVIQKSPPTIRSYRNRLLNLTFWNSLFVVQLLLLQPSGTLFNSLVCLRPLGFIHKIHVDLFYVVLFVVIVGSFNIALAVWLCFFFRYVQLAHPKISEWLQSSKGTVSCALCHLCVSIGSGIFTYMFLSTMQQFSDKEELLFCFEPTGNLATTVFICFLLVFTVCSCVSFLALTILSLRVLRSQQSTMSAKTYRLQLELTVNLIMLTVFPVVFDIVPVVLTCLGMYFKFNSLETIFLLVFHLPCVEVICCWCVTLAFVTPYRHAVRDLVLQILDYRPTL